MSWAAGHCRTCETSDFRFAESIGIPGNVQLEESGRCPNCGREWGRPDVCHVCGGKAKAGSWWDTIGFHDPEPFPEADFFDGAVWSLEVEVEEGGRLPRTELDRIMRELYPSPASPLLFYRQAWRVLLGAFITGGKLGVDRQMEDARLEAAKAGKG